jgi:hypothetical protein
MTGIPVFAGPRIIACCDTVSIRRYVGAPNAEVVRRRKTNEIVQVNLASCGDDSMLRSTADSPSPTYNERLETRTLTTLKRYDDGTGQLVRWGISDSFGPRRFNPDHLVMAQRPDGPDRRSCSRIVAKPADAPRVQPARFSVKRDLSLPWSAENSRDVF